MNDINFYKNNGYYIKKNLLSKDICKDIISQLNEISTNMNIPHTNIQFGYGNVINHSLSNIIINNNYIKYLFISIFNIYKKMIFYINSLFK